MLETSNKTVNCKNPKLQVDLFAGQCSLNSMAKWRDDEAARQQGSGTSRQCGRGAVKQRGNCMPPSNRVNSCLARSIS